jgi:CheY-like chemotaxis protein
MAPPLILCIDDNEEGLEVRKLVLEAAGYSVLTAADGARWLELFADNPIAGVVLDYAMPGMNGGQVAAEMKRLKPDVPIVLLSGCVSEMPPDALNVVDLFIAKGSPTLSLTQELKKLVPQPLQRKLPQREELIVKAEEIISASRGVTRRTRRVVRESQRHLDSWSNKNNKE